MSHDIGDWRDDAAKLHYCGLCHQVYPSGDIFFDHRENSEFEVAHLENEDGDAGFFRHRKLEPREEFPSGATVGELEPCEPKFDELFQEVMANISQREGDE